VHCAKARTDAEFASKLLQLLDDGALREKMANGARALAAEHDMKKTAHMLKELYEELAGGRPVT
jgi:glycosyltransferase involved in cell wall biosynthesis